MNKGRRTRTGCLCCRRRHKKCDEQKPSCKFCLSKGLECEWPLKGSVFVNYQQNSGSQQLAAPTQPQQFTFDINCATAEPREVRQSLISTSPKSTNIVTTPRSSISDETSSVSSAPTSTTSEDQDFDTIKPNYTIQSYPTYIREASRPKTQLPSLKSYHFVIPRDNPVSLTEDKLAKRLSVDSLLN